MEKLFNNDLRQTYNLSANIDYPYIDLQGRLHLPVEVEQLANPSDAIEYVWVPSEQVSFLQVFVPGKKTSEWQRALPFAIEESVGQPIEDLSIIFFRHASSGMTDVAIVEKSLMQLWVDELRAHHLAKAQLIADCFKVPYDNDISSENTNKLTKNWVVYDDDKTQRSYLRTNEASGLSADQAWMRNFLNHAVKHRPDIQLKTLSALPEPDWQKLKAYGLRQHEFEPLHSKQSLLKLWRLPLALLLSIFLLTSVNSWLTTQKLLQQTQVYKQKTVALFKQLFPDVKRIINIEVQAKSRLLQSNQSKEKLSFIELLHRTDSMILPLETKQKLRLLSASWMNEQLIIKLEANNIETLQTLNKQMNHQLISKLTISQASGQKVEGELHVRQH